MPEPTRADAPSSTMSVPQKLYSWLAAFFVTALITANLIGAKFFYFGDVSILGLDLRIEHSVGMFAFPITFLLTDLLNEYYGKRAARRVTYIGLATSSFAFLLIYLARVAPPAPADRTFVVEQTFQDVFKVGNVMIVASLAAYMLGQLTDIWVFHIFKRITGGRLLWLRATGSTVVSQGVDSLTISLVLGYGSALATGERASLEFILVTAAKGYILKFVIAVCITPLIYAGHAVMHRVLGLQPLPAASPRA